MVTQGVRDNGPKIRPHPRGAACPDAGHSAGHRREGRAHGTLCTPGGAEIGYSIGTIYNLFEDFDDLVLHVNGESVDRLYERCTAEPLESGPEDTLRALARAYIGFVHDHPRLWSLLFEYRALHPGPLPQWYDEKFARLFALMDRAMVPLFPPGREAEMRHSARVLRASLHGMCSLEAAGAIAEPASALVDTLITYYVAGLRSDLGDRTTDLAEAE